MVKKIAIIGGGASGFFAAIRSAELAHQENRAVDIRIFEMTSSYLRKVRISGGGRCNVTHHEFNTKTFCQNYPRGSKELLSPFKMFQAADTVAWFKKRGIRLKHESDGRMFPITNSSATIIDCFLAAASKYKIKLISGCNVKSLKIMEDHAERKISLYINQSDSFLADAVLIATGSLPGGYRLAKNLGHKITDLAPSLFSFKIQDPLLQGLSGTSFTNAKLKLKMAGGTEFKQTGPLLITHWGLSGPALLKLSAWAAREMKVAKYQAQLFVNWIGCDARKDVEDILCGLKTNNKNAFIKNIYPKKLTKRFWLQLLQRTKIKEDFKWQELPNIKFNDLIDNLFMFELQINGKNRFKEEFVECGGVSLREVNFQTMESRICPGLYFAGEILDIDGVTGGFNFQNAWTSGWIAGCNM